MKPLIILALILSLIHAVFSTESLASRRDQETNTRTYTVTNGFQEVYSEILTRSLTASNNGLVSTETIYETSFIPKQSYIPQNYSSFVQENDFMITVDSKSHYITIPKFNKRDNYAIEPVLTGYSVPNAAEEIVMQLVVPANYLPWDTAQISFWFDNAILENWAATFDEMTVISGEDGFGFYYTRSTQDSYQSDFIINFSGTKNDQEKIVVLHVSGILEEHLPEQELLDGSFYYETITSSFDRSMIVGSTTRAEFSTLLTESSIVGGLTSSAPYQTSTLSSNWDSASTRVSSSTNLPEDSVTVISTFTSASTSASTSDSSSVASCSESTVSDPSLDGSYFVSTTMFSTVDSASCESNSPFGLSTVHSNHLSDFDSSTFEASAVDSLSSDLSTVVSSTESYMVTATLEMTFSSDSGIVSSFKSVNPLDSSNSITYTDDSAVLTITTTDDNGEFITVFVKKSLSTLENGSITATTISETLTTPDPSYIPHADALGYTSIIEEIDFIITVDSEAKYTTIPDQYTQTIYVRDPVLTGRAVPKMPISVEMELVVPKGYLPWDVGQATIVLENALVDNWTATLGESVLDSGSGDSSIDVFLGRANSYLFNYDFIIAFSATRIDVEKAVFVSATGNFVAHMTSQMQKRYSDGELGGYGYGDGELGGYGYGDGDDDDDGDGDGDGDGDVAITSSFVKTMSVGTINEADSFSSFSSSSLAFTVSSSPTTASTLFSSFEISSAPVSVTESSTDSSKAVSTSDSFSMAFPSTLVSFSETMTIFFSSDSSIAAPSESSSFYSSPKSSLSVPSDGTTVTSSTESSNLISFSTVSFSESSSLLSSSTKVSLFEPTTVKSSSVFVSDSSSASAYLYSFDSTPDAYTLYSSSKSLILVSSSAIINVDSCDSSASVSASSVTWSSESSFATSTLVSATEFSTLAASFSSISTFASSTLSSIFENNTAKSYSEVSALSSSELIAVASSSAASFPVSVNSTLTFVSESSSLVSTSEYSMVTSVSGFPSIVVSSSGFHPEIYSSNINILGNSTTVGSNLLSNYLIQSSTLASSFASYSGTLTFTSDSSVLSESSELSFPASHFASSMEISNFESLTVISKFDNSFSFPPNSSTALPTISYSDSSISASSCETSIISSDSATPALVSFSESSFYPFVSPSSTYSFAETSSFSRSPMNFPAESFEVVPYSSLAHITVNTFSGASTVASYFSESIPSPLNFSSKPSSDSSLVVSGNSVSLSNEIYFTSGFNSSDSSYSNNYFHDISKATAPTPLSSFKNVSTASEPQTKSTSVLIITSCSDTICSIVPLTTGLTTVTVTGPDGMYTSYTTYCPVSSQGMTKPDDSHSKLTASTSSSNLEVNDGSETVVASGSGSSGNNGAIITVSKVSVDTGLVYTSTVRYVTASTSVVAGSGSGSTLIDSAGTLLKSTSTVLVTNFYEGSGVLAVEFGNIYRSFYSVVLVFIASILVV